MATTQSAATAAFFAIDYGMPVQQASYEKLRIRLEADGQVLTRRPAKQQPLLKPSP